MAESSFNSGFSKVYQFKIVLKDSKPPIWRRIQVPGNYTFSELSDSILKSMGWKGTHLHVFKIKNPQTMGEDTIGIHFDDENHSNTVSLSEKKTYIKNFFLNEKDNAVYTYDFGDEWKHDVKLEKILPIDPGITYPTCIAGKRACPPEDCGGIWEYTSILEILGKKSNLTPEEESTIQEMKKNNFNPNKFEPNSCFDNS